MVQGLGAMQRTPTVMRARGRMPEGRKGDRSVQADRWSVRGGSMATVGWPRSADSCSIRYDRAAAATASGAVDGGILGVRGPGKRQRGNQQGAGRQRAEAARCGNLHGE
ncbi:hypothetical protein AD428_02285 [Achromobacter sp. DMS1]|nr:hypothetical protein AD428_02285 [Achromobacter sp. DMS1]